MQNEAQRVKQPYLHEGTDKSTGKDVPWYLWRERKGESKHRNRHSNTSLRELSTCIASTAPLLILRAHNVLQLWSIPFILLPTWAEQQRR